MNTKKEARVNVRMDADVRGWLDAQASKRRTTASEIVREIILAAFAKREGEHRAPLGKSTRRRPAGTGTACRESAHCPATV
jgi:hypothetical protein